MRSMGLMYRSSYSAKYGRLDGTEADCRAALDGFRAAGEKFGTAITLMELAEFAELRADHAAAIATLEEAEAAGHELSAWADLTYIDGTLAIVRARAGDFARARRGMERAERAAADLGSGPGGETTIWLRYLGAELAWREGDLPRARRCCEEALAGLAEKSTVWWQSMHTVVLTRLAMTSLATGDADRCRELLARALRMATGWVERPSLAAVLDATAVLAERDNAELAATLLGAAHSIRGAFDESSLDAPAVRAAARDALGRDSFDAAYRRGRELGYDDALALASEVLTHKVKR
jgi:hypothetical protein